MARIRSIKPDFFASEDVSALPLRARLTWIGLWTQCDDHGRTKDVVRLIKAAVWPLDDVTLSDIEEDLITLADARRIVRYTRDGKGFLAVVNWHVHQAINKPSASQYPAPPVPVGPTSKDAKGYCAACHGEFMAQPVDNTGAEAEFAGQTHPGRTPGGLPEDSRNVPVGLPLGKERKGREGTRARASAGTLPERSANQPPPRCPTHINDPTPPPCGACADARRQHDAWAKTRPTPVIVSPDCPDHPGHPASRCSACASVATPPPPGWRTTTREDTPA